VIQQQRLVGVEWVPKDWLETMPGDAQARYISDKLTSMLKAWAKKATEEGAMRLTELPAIEWHNQGQFYVARLTSQILREGE
jgi:hypothetical protein